MFKKTLLKEVIIDASYCSATSVLSHTRLQHCDGWPMSLFNSRLKIYNRSYCLAAASNLAVICNRTHISAYALESVSQPKIFNWKSWYKQLHPIKNNLWGGGFYTTYKNNLVAFRSLPLAQLASGHGSSKSYHCTRLHCTSGKTEL